MHYVCMYNLGINCMSFIWYIPEMNQTRITYCMHSVLIRHIIIMNADI